MERITKINQVPVRIICLLVLNDLIDTTAQLLMKKGLGLAELNGVASFFHHLVNFADPNIGFFWGGLGLYISNFFLWMTILSGIDLSVALPLACVGYVLVPVSAVIFLHESVAPLRWVGLALIVFGIYFVSQSKSKEAR